MIKCSSSGFNPKTERLVEYPKPNIDDDRSDSGMCDITMRVTVDVMNSCEEAFREKDSILRPADPRIEKFIFDIHHLSIEISKHHHKYMEPANNRRPNQGWRSRSAVPTLKIYIPTTTYQ